MIPVLYLYYPKTACAFLQFSKSHKVLKINSLRTLPAVASVVKIKSDHIAAVFIVYFYFVSIKYIVCTVVCTQHINRYVIEANFFANFLLALLLFIYVVVLIYPSTSTALPWF